MSNPLKQEQSLELAVVSNCNFSALIDRKAQVVWSCFPRIDGDPVFCSLLKRSTSTSSDIGFFDVLVPGLQKTEQSYLKNTAILSTKLHTADSSLEIVDFCPRFESADRDYRPNMLVRIIRPLKGRPRAQIRLRPTFGYGWGTPEKTRGSNHIRYLLSNLTIRLTTNAPISYVVDEVLFEVDEPLYLVLMPDDSLKQPLSELAESYLVKTTNFWKNWTRALTIPFEWQEPVLRAAITLKAMHFEETGALVAALTTSVPTGPNGENKDHRYCWLRNSSQVVHALNNLGATATMESYLNFLSNIVADYTEKDAGDKRIQSVYGLSLETRLFERDMHRLPGYRGLGPVKLGTQDAEQSSPAGYGTIILALTQTFFDHRLKKMGDVFLFERLETLGEHSKNSYATSDKGEVNTSASVLAWAAADRLSKIAKKLEKNDRAQYWSTVASEIHGSILSKAWNAQLNSFTSHWGGQEVTAELLSIVDLGFVSPSDDKYKGTLDRIEKDLVKKGFVLQKKDSSISKNSDTFRYIRALAAAGRTKEARELFEKALQNVNHAGLISETVHTESGELWGNFPHNTATVGLIECASALSSSWADLYQ